MKKIALIFLFLLAFVPKSFSADWVAQEDGTWTLSVSLTASTTQEKDMIEQVRKWHNYEFRCGGLGEICEEGEDTLSPSEWVQGYFFGFSHTQVGKSDKKLYRMCSNLWGNFKRAVNRKYLSWVSSPSSNPETNALNAVVPSPPAR